MVLDLSVLVPAMATRWLCTRTPPLGGLMSGGVDGVFWLKLLDCRYLAVCQRSGFVFVLGRWLERHGVSQGIVGNK